MPFDNPDASKPGIAIRQTLFAAAALTCLLLFSALNTYQKTHLTPAPGNWPATSFGLAATILLLGAFALCANRALQTAPPATRLPPSPATTPAYDPLLTLRAFACFMVLAGHGIGFAFRSPALIPLARAHNPIWLVTASPEAGVWIFFTLSGYLMGKGFSTGRYTPNRASIASFYRNRLLRILPLYWATLTLFSLLAIPAIFAPRNLPAFLNMLLFNVDGHLPYMPIGAMWSISTEMQFYAAAPVLFILLRALARRPAAALAAAVAITAAAIAYRAHAFAAGGLAYWYLHAYAPLFINLDVFLAGMATAELVQRFRGRILPHGLGYAATAVVLLYIADTYLRAYGVLAPEPQIARLFCDIAPTLTALLTALTIFCLETAPKLPHASAASRLWRRTEIIGILTYAAYCAHEPIFLLIKNTLPPPPTIPLSLLLCLAVILAVFAIAYAAHKLIERPFESLKES
jgi:peptidoglycan/LPS O-acetylase OafA/YrhL